MKSAADKRELLQIPPFEDSHIHFTLDGRPPETTAPIPAMIEAFLSHGIMSLREMGHKTGIGLEAKRIASATPLRVKASGIALYKKGTYGVFLGKGIEKRAQIPDLIGEIGRSGADFLKVVNSGIVSAREKGLVTPGGFTPEELGIICHEAGERSLGIACHVNGDRAIREAVAAGVSSIEHGFFISSETLQEMKERGVSWTPTVCALSAIRTFIPPSELPTLQEIIEGQLAAVSYAASIGVRLRIGTDSGSKGVSPGDSFFEEMRIFQKAGLTRNQIIAAACLDTSEIEKGNYLVVERDFISTGRIEEIVLKRGEGAEAR